MKRSPLFWIVVVTLFVLGCLVLTCGQRIFATHNNRDPRMSVSSFSPLVLSAGRVSTLPSGDAITMGGGQINNLADPNSPQDAATEAYVLAHATVSGSLTSGFVPVANGASSIVNSLESDNGSVFGSTAQWIIGGGVEFSATTEYTWNGQGAATTTQGAFVSNAADPNHTAYEAINVLAEQNAPFDTSGGAASCNAITAEANCMHAVGTTPNILTNAGLLVVASTPAGSGDGAYSVYSPSGGAKIRVDDGASFGPTAVTSLTASLAIAGSTTLNISEGVTLNSVSGNTSIDGNLQVQSTAKVGDLEFQGVGGINYIYSSSGNEPLEIAADGSGVIDFNNANVVGTGGTGGVKFWNGAGTSVLQWWLNSNGHEMTGGATPSSFSGCGGGTPACAANSPCTDKAARINTGSANTGCVVNLATTYTKIPACLCMDETLSSRLVSCTPAAASITFVLSANSNDVISYQCTGPTNGT